MIISVNKLDNYTSDTGKREIKKTLGKEEFMRLLVTQMQFQDPLKPMENTEFTAQLAQFSSLDQLSGINEGVKSFSDAQSGMNRGQAVNFINKEVKASGNKVYAGGGAAPSVIGYSLDKDVSGVTVNIYDREGKDVRTLEIDPQEAGVHRVEWDGKNNLGETVSQGEYTFSVMAKDAEGKSFDALTNIAGVVTGVSFEAGISYLLVSGIKVPLDHVTEVKALNNNTI